MTMIISQTHTPRTYCRP